MKRFKFSVDEKVTVWIRSCISIEAETIDDAINMLKEVYVEDISSQGLLEYSEIMHETCENLTPASNGGYATIEVFELGKECDAPIITNGKQH